MGGDNFPLFTFALLELFQSTPPYGGREVRSSGSQRFQSTPPYGGRLEPVMRPNWKSSFNPRLDTIIKVDGKEK